MTARHRPDDADLIENEDEPSPIEPRNTESWELEDLLTLEEAAKCLPEGRHTATLHWWV